MCTICLKCPLKINAGTFTGKSSRSHQVLACPLVGMIPGHHVYPAGPWGSQLSMFWNVILLFHTQLWSDLALWSFSGTLEHAAHPSTVFSFLWPLGCTFLPSEQAEQRPLCAPVSNTHTHSCPLALQPHRLIQCSGCLTSCPVKPAGPWVMVGETQD